MSDKPFQKSIPITRIFLDVENPRYIETQESQNGALKTMVELQGPKIINLAEHIVKNGTDPSDLTMVIPLASGEELNHVVVDGNRRLVALKLLESTSIAGELFHGKKLEKIKKLALRYEKNPISELRCVVFPDRDAADTWIQLRHRGQQEGIGLVPWDTQAGNRYDERRGKRRIANEILKFAEENIDLSEEAKKNIKSGKFVTTNLDRLIGTPEVREKLGIQISGKKLLFLYPQDEVKKGLKRVIEEIATGKLKVGRIYGREQRLEYINKLGEDELPDPETRFSEPMPMEDAISKKGEVKGSHEKKKIKKHQFSRNTLIPRDLNWHIDEHRIYMIFRELKNLDLNEFENAGAVLLRVFVELSLDYYLEHSVKLSPKQIDDFNLGKKLGMIITHFEDNSIMTKYQLGPIKKHANGQTWLAASYRTMHGYVHNRFFLPRASEIKVAWDEMQLFIEKVWSE